MSHFVIKSSRFAILQKSFENYKMSHFVIKSSRFAKLHKSFENCKMRPFLLQNVTVIYITKCNSYFITNCHKSLLQNASVQFCYRSLIIHYFYCCLSNYMLYMYYENFIAHNSCFLKKDNLL